MPHAPMFSWERHGNRVIVVAEDNGLGFDADVARFAQQGRLGLAGMQERARCLGGSFVIESTVGAGNNCCRGGSS